LSSLQHLGDAVGELGDGIAGGGDLGHDRGGRLNSTATWASSCKVRDWSTSRRWMFTATVALGSALMAPDSL
jgi:hypothetical protein